MLSYEPGSDPVRRADPRVKLAVQAAFAVGVFAHTEPEGLLGFTGLALLFLLVGRVGPVEALREYGPFVPIMVLAPVVAGLRLGPPWLDLGAMVDPALASYRSVLLLALGALYVKTTPVSESRAAVQWLVPGRVGRLLAVGVAIVFRLLPQFQRDLALIRQAIAARLGTERPVHKRMGLVSQGGLRRALSRGDSLSVAMRARALSWNPTPPSLSITGVDYAGLVIAAGLAASGFAEFLA